MGNFSDFINNDNYSKTENILVASNDTEYLKLQLESLQNSKENEEHVKRMRHDLKNHLAIINTLCEEERYEELREYMGL